MKLSTALRVRETPTLAIAGAGGKTSTMLCLAVELESAHRSVLCSSTTHFGFWQVQAQDSVLQFSDEEMPALPAELPDGIVFITGDAHGSDRLRGLNEVQITRLHQIAVERQMPLLIEADGARQRALKAPAEHEPAIPPWVDHVVLCAGLSGLGKPLTGETVHRPEHFSRLTGLAQGETITPEGLSRMLAHPQGGLKNIPPTARRSLLLNQVDTEALQAQAYQIARQVQQAFHSVIIAALPRLGDQAMTIDQIRHASPVIHAVHEPVAGIVLAAGGATRYGELKQVVVWNDHPLVWYSAQAALAAGLSPVIVVTGAGAERVSAALSGLPVRLVHNPDWEAGQSTSLQAGLRVLPATVGGAVFLLADQPNGSAGLIQALVEAHCRSLAPIVAPLIDGQRGNPVLFDQTTFADLMRIRGDQGGRSLFSRTPVEYIPWHDRSVLLDIDEPGDLAKLDLER